MTREELRVFTGGWFCGCGSPEDAYRALLTLLRLHPLYENRPAVEAFVPDDGIQMLLLYTLDHFELTEHGGSVEGGWLTDKGKQVVAALEIESADDFETLCRSACVHGFDIDDQTHDCMQSLVSPLPEVKKP